MYCTSIRLSSTVPFGNFVVTVILGLLLTFTFDVLSLLFIVLTIFFPFVFTFVDFNFNANYPFTDDIINSSDNIRVKKLLYRFSFAFI